MSGHSKWSKVKNQKAVTDVRKAAAFTKASRAISNAVRAGGGITDPEKNFRLRIAIDKARAVNMPKENIDRALAKSRENETAAFQEAVYEAYAPGNIAMLIATLTDNPNRAVSSVKNAVEHSGGSMVAQGAVSRLFEFSGIITLPKQEVSSDDIFLIALEAGAGDIRETENRTIITVKTESLSQIERILRQAGISIAESALGYFPKITQQITDKETAVRLSELITALEDLDDVQKVYTNAEDRGNQ